MFLYFNELLSDLSITEVMLFSFVHAIYYRGLNEGESRFFVCSNDYIADKLKISQPTISKALKHLNQLGYIEISYNPTATGQLRYIVPKLVDLKDVFKNAEGGKKNNLGGTNIFCYPLKDSFMSPQKNLIHNNNLINNNTNNNKESADALIIVNNNDSIIAKWNAIAERYGLASITALTPARSKQLKQRLAEAGGQDMFFTIVEKAIKNSDFLRGKNQKRWKASFDFFLRQSSFVKSAEGVYSRRAGNSPIVQAVTGETTEAEDLFSEFNFNNQMEEK